jgi:hypothetical protein
VIFVVVVVFLLEDVVDGCVSFDRYTQGSCFGSHYMPMKKLPVNQ